MPTKPNAVDALVRHKARIDEALTRLQALSADHFGAHPDEVGWDTVGSVEHLANELSRLADWIEGKPE